LVWRIAPIPDCKGRASLGVHRALISPHSAAKSLLILRSQRKISKKTRFFRSYCCEQAWKHCCTSFVVIKKPATKARKGTNPFTGEEMMFKAKPARKIVRARPVKAAKDAV
jgi:hypothetical protein